MLMLQVMGWGVDKLVVSLGEKRHWRRWSQSDANRAERQGLKKKRAPASHGSEPNIGGGSDMLGMSSLTVMA